MYDAVTGVAAPVEGLSAGAQPFAATHTLRGAGTDEILAVGFSVPGLVGLRPVGGGTWANDPDLIDTSSFTGLAAYPSRDGVVRHIVATLEPSTIQVIEP